MASVRSVFSHPRLRSGLWLLCALLFFVPAAEAKRKKSSDPLPDLTPTAPARPGTGGSPDLPGAEKKPAPATEAPAKPARPGSPPPAKPAAAAGLVVPGGGLIAHERAGGHLLSRHAGKSEAELIARLRADAGIASSSSFVSRELAEEAVAFALSVRQKQVAGWLKLPREERLVLDIRLNQPVGISVTRRTWMAESVKGIRLVLVKDADFRPTGWRILTGYPQP